MGYRQDAACCFDTFLADNHGSVVQRTVFEKDVLDKPLVDVGIDEFARAYDVVEGQVTFDDD